MREFFTLVSNWLQCRWYALNMNNDKVFLFIGEMDYHTEMFLFLQEMKLGRIHKNK